MRKDDHNMARKASKGSSQMMMMMTRMINMVTIWQGWLQRDDLGRRRGPTRRLARGKGLEADTSCEWILLRMAIMLLRGWAL